MFELTPGVRQYLFTGKVSRFCLLPLESSVRYVQAIITMYNYIKLYNIFVEQYMLCIIYA